MTVISSRWLKASVETPSNSRNKAALKSRKFMRRDALKPDGTAI
jgi:hypothetical protein